MEFLEVEMGRKLLLQQRASHNEIYNSVYGKAMKTALKQAYGLEDRHVNAFLEFSHETGAPVTPVVQTAHKYELSIKTLQQALAASAALKGFGNQPEKNTLAILLHIANSSNKGHSKDFAEGLLRILDEP